LNTIADTPPVQRSGATLPVRDTAPEQPPACFHCGDPCAGSHIEKEGKRFCCPGCLCVHDLLAEGGLGHFYDLNRHPGVRIRSAARQEQWAYLKAPDIERQLLDFSDGTVSRVTFHVPSIHCVACVWLLENLFRLHPGIGRSQVNFPKREVAITFAPGKLKLSELVVLLASIGYEPVLTLGTLEKPAANPARRRQWLRIGVAGFGFGNIMLLSLPSYLGLDRLSAPFFQAVFGYLSLALALPVLVYSASDYWRSALLSFRQRMLTLDVPIVLGLLALYGQSASEVLSGRGEGYLDSLCGLVFFLLCGRVFQQKTHERLAFDRDFKSFFPLSVVRQTPGGEESVAASQLQVGDRVVLRHRELVPADATLVSGAALMDYSFVTGESEPVPRQVGECLYAGGQQVGGRIEVQIVKPVSQSYLTSLWNHETFQKRRDDDLNSLTNRYSRHFTALVIGVALVAAFAWWLWGDPGRGIRAFTSVLIVACPCALALAAPFTLGTAQRWLVRINVFVRNAHVIERLAQVNTIVFDKTGTLTSADGANVTYQSATSQGLSETEAWWVCSLARHSTHPHSVRIVQDLDVGRAPLSIDSFNETPGFGLEGRVAGHAVHLGSRAWLEGNRVRGLAETDAPGSRAYLAIDGQFRGAFLLSNSLRPEADTLLQRLTGRYDLALLSGDNERERERFRALFPGNAHLDFNQSPLAKLGFIERLQRGGKVVMMVGDGLNDAGALKQSDVGVAVVERVGAFSPASDVILDGARVRQLASILGFARRAAQIVRFSFGISALYNVVGIGIAAAGVLSPVICAVLMPVSSVSVVAFACGVTTWEARRRGLIFNLERRPPDGSVGALRADQSNRT
jgi:P-type Cu+ transporter